MVKGYKIIGEDLRVDKIFEKETFEVDQVCIDLGIIENGDDMKDVNMVGILEVLDL